MALQIKGMDPKMSSKTPNYKEFLVSKPIVASILTEKKTKGEGYGPMGDEKIIHPGVFCTKNSGILITVEGGRTINLGNYESARIGVTITIPCDPENLNEAYEYGTNWISAKIEEALKGMNGK